MYYGNSTEFNYDELFNYELGDDIDDQAVLGVDEDELLLSDEEQNVSNEEKQKIKEDAEQWVESQINEEFDSNSFKIVNINNATDKDLMEVKIIDQGKLLAHEQTEVTPNACPLALLNLPTLKATTVSRDDYTIPLSILKQQQGLQVPNIKEQHLTICDSYKSSIADKVIASNNNPLYRDLSSITSCSTNIGMDISASLQTSQESSEDIVTLCSNNDDFEDNREKRTNIKTTSERNVESTTDLKDKIRFVSNKRNISYQIRPHGIRNASFFTQRPLLRYPHGQFLPQQSSNLYTTHSTQASNLASNQTVNVNNLHGTPNQLDPLNSNHMPHLRSSYPAFRTPVPINFRLPNPGIYNHVPHDYSVTSGSAYNSNFVQNQTPSRPIYRPEISMQSGLRAGTRIQRPILQSVSNQNYINSPIRVQQIQHHTVTMPSNIQTSGSGISVSSIQQSSSMRPSKVLINPNFKGGVEAATSKFIKETQFMTSISNHVSHLQSDEELLRQQEEFINNNRHHIEKRRNKRSSTPSVLRRSRSATRSRSRSRNRSFSPQKRFTGSHFDRVCGVSSNNERYVDRDRERIPRLDSRERERGPTPSCTYRANRFRRANSRDFESRYQTGSYPKRRRSVSPASTRSALNRRAPDREKYDVEEDEETRAYRIEIEKQKALREKMLRDKELKRRKNLEDKLHEDKRTIQTRSSNCSYIKTNVENQQLQELQKLKPLIVTERKIISLKKRQQHGDNEDDNICNSQTTRKPESHHIPKQAHPYSHSQSCRKKLTAEKVLPESKRTLTDHLTNARNSGSVGGDETSQNNNIPHMKFIHKIEINAMNKFDAQRLSSSNEDEVELDFDEDELMLEEEDRLLATPTPSPPPTKQVSHSPTQDLSNSEIIADIHNKNINIMSRTSTKSVFTASRRIILKSSSPKTVFKNRQGNNNHRGSHSSGTSSRKGIFDRLDIRKHIRRNSNDEKTKSRRIIINHD
ncbi:uncharacterized protein LOC119663825 isoform X2 [Teleopsis dalmanni]|uniref:uncharacterized protein LOC119663825 isoform X2 n=1 Tax=Teleopsis dalmanni TaxID=139649 RepID=UPI0018CDDC49|nr:uncharacterized protein LOC119663825 isoform X2 [Teleopsis dalmanni]